MVGTLKVESTLNDRYQTAVPEAVRRALHLGKRDKICYTIRPSGEVILSRAEVLRNDPVIDHFLRFLAREIVNRPHELQTLDAEFVRHLQSLAEGLDIDLDAPLSTDDE